ncbi:hypothetical protein EG341_03255 [Chryseobacterium lactis]|uniref:hypothetical protein n=1 Tax=Chryseobacterium lactis TaxID=1241981 RepID=UPI000F50ED13|nr:hypothetical protein [Chryseobacterium lactis]AZB03012.1 hypothetical protein EG341_03255 [Chryseobacterium lactis]
MKAFKKQHNTLKRNEMKIILAGGLPPVCNPMNCNNQCISFGLEGGICDSTGLCSCGPFSINS